MMDDYGNEVTAACSWHHVALAADTTGNVKIYLDGRALVEAIVSLRRGDGDEA